MENRMTEFSALLGDLVEQAQISGNVLDVNFIKDFFSDLELGEKEFHHIYAYLKAAHIEIKGFDTNEEVEKEVEDYKKAAKERMDAYGDSGDGASSKEGGAETNEEKVESAFLQMYFDDLQAIQRLGKKEEEALLTQLLQGDEGAEREYIERKLHDVIKMAKDFKLSEDYFEELIGEGNIGLLVGLTELKKENNIDNAKEFVDARILSAMQDFLDESLDEENSATSMISKVSFVSDAAKKLKEDKGRTPSLMELAAYTNLTEEELKVIMKLSADQLLEK